MNDNIDPHPEYDTNNRQWHFHALPKKALWNMRTKALLSSLFLLVLFGAIPAILIKVLQVNVLNAGLIIKAVGIFWLGLLVIYWFTTELEYNYTAFHIDDEGLVIRKGLLWRKETFVLRSRVQHIDVMQDPLARLFGLASIKVYTAGTKLGSISLSGLDKEDAEYIRNELISKTADTL